MTNEKIVFNLEKMRKFAERDAMIRYVANDLQRQGYEESHYLEVAFNSYVMGDHIMEQVYLSMNLE